MGIKISLKTDQAIDQVENSVAVAIRLMMEDVHRLSTPVTPKRPDPIGGTLRTAVTKTMPSKMVGIMKWHVPYADYQERGFTTGPVRNYSTPGTHAHFIAESIEKVVPKIGTYLRMGGLI